MSDTDTFSFQSGLAFQLPSGPVTSAFAEREILPAFASLLDKAHAAELTTAQFIEALLNVHGEVLASMLGPEAAGNVLRDLGDHLKQRAAQA